jgi:arsenite-transporting ATPase
MEPILNDHDLKFVFVGGKGGVGKTTSSSALAMQLSYDRKVLLISTDPAHSLSDAFRCQFSNEPTTVPEAPNLDVMEVNPEANLQGEIAKWADMAAQVGFDELTSKVAEFQEWLTGIPGIDEATALSSVIGLIESGTYDTIVFDTAPTGHTLKLLQLPSIIQMGLDKLENWQATVWNAWQSIKQAAGGEKDKAAAMRDMVKERLQEYKKGITKVGAILTDPKRTSFVVVCIAEFLSISESQRLLRELVKFNVAVSHVIVNQLMQGCVVPEQLEAARALLSGALSGTNEALLRQMNTSITICNARASIQTKYLGELRASPEAEGITVVELPLLASEVTGAPALLDFSQRMVADGYRGKAPSALVDWKPTPMDFSAPPAAMELDAAPAEEAPKAPQTIPEMMAEMAQQPDMARLLENPRIAAAYEEVKANPMACMNYMADPEFKPIVDKVMAKLFGG